MLLLKPHGPHPLFIRSLATSTAKTTPNWRTEIKQTQLVSKISTILLQRHNWAPLLQTLNLSSKLTPSLFFQILHRTQTCPQLSLNFFNWACKNLGFKPDLKSQCKLTQMLIRVGLCLPARPILDALIETHPSTQIVDSLIRSCKGTDSHSLVFSSIVECYCSKGLFLQALEVSQKIKEHGHVILTHSCNAVLNTLQDKNETRLAWCFYASILRNGVLGDQNTWSVIARILRQDGNIERIVRIIDMGVYNSTIYGIVIECYSERGNLKAAFNHLKEMCSRKLDPGFSIYGSILDGACKYKDAEVIELVMCSIVKKGYIGKQPFLEYDSTIQKLSDLEKTYAAEMYFRKATNENIALEDVSYGCMLRAFSEEGRTKDAIEIYHVILEKEIVVNYSCYSAFGNALCKEDPSDEVNTLLIDVIGRGFSPCLLELSKFITSQCKKRRWRQVEELLNVILEKGFSPDSFCCSSLVKHYCSSKRIDSAIALHHKMEKLDGTLDVTTYNILLHGLFKERRVEEALMVFDYMRRKNILSSASFSIMVTGLCRENELRKAMKFHDEMLKMGLKPDTKTYKRMISGFK